MKKTTQNKFYDRLAQYGALSLAITGLADANGQIVYTDVDPDAGGTQIIDLNGDAADDFAIVQLGSASAPYAVRAFPTGGSANVLGNAFAGITSSGFNYPSNFTAGQVISSASPWNSAYAYHDFCYGGGYPNSAFCNVTDGYVGLRFDIAGAYHYGWARVDVTSVGGISTYVLKDYAYNATAGASIEAGQTSLSVDEFSANAIKIVALNKSIGLYNLPQATEYRVLDISGKSIINGTSNGSSYVIEANGIANGIYIIELSDSNSNAVIRKKIVL